MMEEAEYAFVAKTQLTELEGKEEEKGQIKQLIQLQPSKEVIHAQLKKTLDRLIILRKNSKASQNEEILLLPAYNNQECIAFNMLLNYKETWKLQIQFPSYYAFLNLSDGGILAGGQNVKTTKNMTLFLEINYKERPPLILPSMLNPKRRMGICAESEEELEVFIVGGHDGSTQITAVQRYTRKTQQWNKQVQLNVKRHGPGCVGVQDGRYILTFGGYNDSSDALSTIERLDRQNPVLKWDLIRNVIPRQRYMSVCSWGQGRQLLLFGGMISTSTYLLKYNDAVSTFTIENLQHQLKHSSYGDKRKCVFKRLNKDVFATDVSGTLHVLQPKGWLTC